MKTESELIRAVQSGDKDAFNEIIWKFEPLILSTVSEYLNGELFGADDRDDLYQEAAIALYSEMPLMLRPEPLPSPVSSTEMMMEGLPYFSTMREATMPITP